MAVKPTTEISCSCDTIYLKTLGSVLYIIVIIVVVLVNPAICQHDYVPIYGPGLSIVSNVHRAYSSAKIRFRSITEIFAVHVPFPEQLFPEFTLQNMPQMPRRCFASGFQLLL